MIFRDPPKTILSPCIGVCKLDAHGLCEGCYRTAGEIAQWMHYDDAERARLMNEILPTRAAQVVAQ
jgi:uncharacterized protein